MVSKDQRVTIPDEWFKPKNKDIEEAEAVVRPSLSYWKDAWRQNSKKQTSDGRTNFS